MNRHLDLSSPPYGGYHQTAALAADAELTHVCPGTPGGEYLRRFWHPVALTIAVSELPKLVRVLGEDLVLFRDGNGRFGLLHRHCPHRGASLEYGICEARGLRCCYHGWLFDVDGTILETPGEPPDSSAAAKLRQSLRHGAYPVIDTNAQSVLAYRFDGTGPGWDTGNFSGSAGGVGWHMTVNEILDVTRALTKAQLVSIGSFSDIINRSWGLNSPLGGEATDAGNIYYKAGLWRDSGNPAVARVEQCFVLFQPTKQIEIVVFVNSNVGMTGASLTNIVRFVFASNIQGP